MSDHVKIQLPTVEAENHERCETCRFWFYEQETSVGTQGICRRYPPSPDVQFIQVYGGSNEENSSWWSQPYILSSNWCGEWQAKRVPSAADAIKQELLGAVERVRYGEDTGCQVDDHDYRVLAAAYLRREHL